MSFDIVDYQELAGSRYTDLFKDDVVFDAMVKSIITPLQSYQIFLKDFHDNFLDIDNSFGQQLDIIGGLVGQPRVLLNFLTEPYFGFEGAANAESFGTEADSGVGGYWRSILNPSSGSAKTLDDITYRKLIKARIIKNGSRGSVNDFLLVMNILTGNTLTRVDVSPISGTALVTLVEPVDPLIGYYLGKVRESGSLIPLPLGVKLSAATVQLPTPEPSAGFRVFAPDVSAVSALEIYIELFSGVATIDWGDGSANTITDGWVDPEDPETHDYTGYVGDAIIAIYGDIKGIEIYASGITEVLEYSNSQRIILGLPDLVSVPPTMPNTITSTQSMFSNCAVFNQPVIIPESVIDTSFMFTDSPLFNQPVIIPESVINTSFMFKGATSFNSEVIIGNSVTDADSMFRGCLVFNQPVIIPESVINTGHMFDGAILFNQPVTLPNAITQIYYMFNGCSNFNSMVLLTSPNVVAANNTFYNCPIFNQDLSGWCVSNLLSEPTDFSTGSALTEPNKPVWGTCPV